MAILNVPNSVASNTSPTEIQLDTMRSYLLNFFNGGQLDETNITNATVPFSSIGPAPDNQSLKFTDSTATITYDSTDDALDITNTAGDVVFGVSGATGSVVFDSATGNVYIQGSLYTNTGKGDQSVYTQWLLTQYRKPLLEYSTSDIVSIQENSITASETLIVMRDRLCEVYDRTCSLAVAANGYDTSHTGTAVSGLYVGLTRTDNRWYYIYATRVRGGTQANATGTYAILVAHTLSPEAGNIGSLDTLFGAGEWLYVGVVRNGYNDAEGADNTILPFVYDENGYCRFTRTTDTNEGLGMTMAELQSTTSNMYCQVYAGNDYAFSVPGVATRLTVEGYRSTNGTEFQYRSSLTNEINAMVTGCYHVSGLTGLEVCCQMEVPVIADYYLWVINGSASTNARITLAGFQDHFV